MERVEVWCLFLVDIPFCNIFLLVVFFINYHHLLMMLWVTTETLQMIACIVEAVLPWFYLKLGFCVLKIWVNGWSLHFHLFTQNVQKISSNCFLLPVKEYIFFFYHSSRVLIGASAVFHYTWPGYMWKNRKWLQLLRWNYQQEDQQRG